MRISFFDNTCKIDQTTNLPLGRLTCDILNDPMDWQAFRDAQAAVTFITPLDDTTVAEYRSSLEANRATLVELQRLVQKHCFYQLTDEAENTFNSVLALYDGLLADMARKATSDDQMALNIGLNFNTTEAKAAMENIDAFVGVHQAAIRVFTQIIDDCVTYIGMSPQQRPIERLSAYGLDKLQAKTRRLVQEAHTASSTQYAPDYEIVTRSDGVKTLAHVVYVNHIAQFMYHEIMNVIMQGHSFRKCKHCGRYFIQYGDRVVEYCDQIPAGATKPCNVIGPTRQFTASLHEDPIKMTYSRVYKKYIAQRRTGTITDAMFKTWAAQAKQVREQAYQDGEKDAIAFQHSLDDLMRGIAAQNVQGG